MMTITPQALTANLGHATPRAIASAGLDAEYERCMEQVMTTYNDLSTLDSAVAAYIVPNAFNRRFLLTANLRSLLHFIKLRSAANAHFSVRRLAQKMCEQICAIMPGFVPFITPSIRESVDSIKMNYFSKV
jgi:thymidylate synthase ThyX